MIYTHCEGTGFLNLDQLPEDIAEEFDATGDENVILNYIKTNNEHDIGVCDCCGDGEGWFGVRGEHYSFVDPPGKNGPYKDNGGYCNCH